MDYGNTARSYFGQFEIHGSENVSKDTQYCVACHPHGTVIFQRTFWRTELMNKIFTREWRMLAASVLFSLPIIREMTLWFGAVDASKSTCEKVLSAGASLVLYPGGLDEANTVASTTTDESSDKVKAADVALLTRTGFIRLAVKFNTPVLPVFTFGELEAVDAVNLLPARLTKWLQKRLRMSTTIFLGRFYSFVPYRVPFNMCIGRAIAVKHCPDGTPQDEVDAEVMRVHVLYKRELQAIYDSNKAKFGYQDRKIIFACGALDDDGDASPKSKSNSDNKIVTSSSSSGDHDHDHDKKEGEGEGEGEGSSNQSKMPNTRVSPRGRAAKQINR